MKRPKHMAPSSRRRARAFGLLEAMVSMAIGGVIVVAAMASYDTGAKARASQYHEWVAFTLAQSQMEVLAAVPRAHVSLNDTNGDSALPASPDDANCSGGVDDSLSSDMRVNFLGQPQLDGVYELCWKVTNDSPSGNLKNVRVVASYPSDGVGGRGHVLLQLLR